MNILIVYATSEGQTRKIADYIAARLAEDGHETRVHDSALTLGGLDLDAFDVIFAAGSVHDQRHQETIVNFAIAQRDRLDSIPSAFVSVSLSAAMKDGELEARRYVDAFIEKTGWRPADTLLVAGALRYSEYDYFRQQIVKFLVLDKDQSIDTEGDCEFTDWEEVARFARSFVAKAGRPSPG